MTDEKVGRLRWLVRRGRESNVRQLAGELGETVRATRILLTGLKDSGEIESVRKNRGSRVRVYYRVSSSAGARKGESGAARGVPRLRLAAS
jgi:hypothetical protein